MDRPRYDSLKYIKRLIAGGDLESAEQALLAKHAALLVPLQIDKVSDENQTITKYRLTVVETQLAVVASMRGKHDEADGWFERARTHYTAFDPVARERMERQIATHLMRKGQADNALAMLESAERALRKIRILKKSSLPEARLELEEAMNLSCKAEAELRIDAGNEQAHQSLVEAQLVLRAGNKRSYELDNLMRLIKYTSIFDPRRTTYIARAVLVNETAVRNPATRLTLIDAACGPVPLAKVVRFVRAPRD